MVIMLGTSEIKDVTITLCITLMSFMTRVIKSPVRVFV